MQGSAAEFAQAAKTRYKWFRPGIRLHVSSDLAGLASLDADNLDISSFSASSIDASFIDNFVPELADRIGLVHWYFAGTKRGGLKLRICVLDTLTADTFTQQLRSFGFKVRSGFVVAPDTRKPLHRLAAQPGATPCAPSHWLSAAALLSAGLLLGAGGYTPEQQNNREVVQQIPAQLQRLAQQPRLQADWLEPADTAITKTKRASVLEARAEAGGETRIELVLQGSEPGLIRHFSDRGWTIQVRRAQEGQIALTLHRETY